MMILPTSSRGQRQIRWTWQNSAEIPTLGIIQTEQCNSTAAGHSQSFPENARQISSSENKSTSIRNMKACRTPPFPSSPFKALSRCLVFCLECCFVSRYSWQLTWPQKRLGIYLYYKNIYCKLNSYCDHQLTKVSASRNTALSKSVSSQQCIFV